jgi:hypothetical protein
MKKLVKRPHTLGDRRLLPQYWMRLGLSLVSVTLVSVSRLRAEAGSVASPLGSGNSGPIAAALTCPQWQQVDREQSIRRLLNRSKALRLQQPETALASFQAAVKLALAEPQMAQRRLWLDRYQTEFAEIVTGMSGFATTRFAILETTQQLVQSLDARYSLAKTRSLMRLAVAAQDLNQPKRAQTWITEAIAASQTIQNQNRSEKVVLAQTLINLAETAIQIHSPVAGFAPPGSRRPVAKTSAIAALLARTEGIVLQLPTTPPRRGAEVERQPLLRWLGLLYVDSGLIDAAERIAEIDPDQSGSIGLRLSEWEFRQGNLDRALARFKALANPSLTHNLWLPVHISAAYLDRGQSAPAEAAFQEAIRLQQRGNVDIPSANEPLVDILTSYAAAGQVAAAQKRLGQVQSISGKAAVWSSISQAHRKAGQRLAANQAFTQALDWLQQLPETERGDRLQAELDYALSSEQPEMAIQLVKLRPKATTIEQIANQAIAQNDLETALQASQLLTLNYPDQKFRPLVQIAKGYSRQGQTDRAIQLAQTIPNQGREPYQVEAFTAIVRTLAAKPDLAQTVRQQALTSRDGLSDWPRNQANATIALELLQSGQPIAQTEAVLEDGLKSSISIPPAGLTQLADRFYQAQQYAAAFRVQQTRLNQLPTPLSQLSRQITTPSQYYRAMALTEPNPQTRIQLLFDLAHDRWTEGRQPEAIALLNESKAVTQTLLKSEQIDRDRLMGEIALTYADWGRSVLAAQALLEITPTNQDAIRAHIRCIT